MHTHCIPITKGDRAANYVVVRHVISLRPLTPKASMPAVLRLPHDSPSGIQTSTDIRYLVLVS
jgi:hypothetical protein